VVVAVAVAVAVVVVDKNTVSLFLIAT